MPSNDPNAPAWLKQEATRNMEGGLQPKAQWIEASQEGHHSGKTCCQRFGVKFLSCVFYLFGILGAIVTLVIERHNAYLLANAWQNLFVSIPCMVVCLFFAWTSIGSAILWSAYG